MTLEERKDLKRLQKKYASCLGNKSLMRIANNRNANGDTPFVEADFKARALELIDPMYKLIKRTYERKSKLTHKPQNV